jgi:tetratricopeptide (TPR) repeat protein
VIDVNEQKQPDATDARAALQRFFSEIRLARATELAQSRRFREAEAVLIQAGKLSENPRGLDLLARIAAQQGQFEKARYRWEAAQRRTPNPTAYVDNIRSLDAAQTAAAVKRKIVVISLGVIAIAALVAVSVTFWSGKKLASPNAQIPRLQPSVPQQQTLQSSPVVVRFQISGPSQNPDKR